MTASTVFHSLYQYKAWSEATLFKVLMQSPGRAAQGHLTEALWHLAHIHIVDNLFIGRLQGDPMPCSSTTTEQPQDIRELQAKFDQANQWFVHYTQTVTDAELEQRVAFAFADGQPGNMSKAEILGHVLSHGLLHRGMVSGLLPHAAAAGWKDHYSTFLKH